ncbi:radical SAM protein [bacterium]|nr:radical SAM protein [bacterium]
MKEDLVFGPVPSRRLGKSLGINNIPPKICTYTCVYCQLGRSLKIEIERKAYYNPEEIFASVKNKIKKVKESKEKIDYLTFVPDGEPTLDINLGKEVDLLKEFDIPIAIITNSSLINRKDVVKDLLKFDLVSIKVDAISEFYWKKIDRPNHLLNLNSILNGIKSFDLIYKGILISETMVIRGIDYKNEFEKIAIFLSSLKFLKKAYISIPIRPPAENWVEPPDEQFLNEVYYKFSKYLGDKVEYLIGYEGNAFYTSGNIKEDILSITSVHPMREDAIEKLLKNTNSDWKAIEELINDDLIKEVLYKGHKFYLKKFYKNR